MGAGGCRLIVNHFAGGDHLARRNHLAWALADGSFLLPRRRGVFAVVVRAHRPVRTVTTSDETDDSQHRDTDSSPVLHRSFSPFRRIFEFDSARKAILASSARHAEPHAFSLRGSATAAPSDTTRVPFAPFLTSNRRRNVVSDKWQQSVGSGTVCGESTQ